MLQGSRCDVFLCGSTYYAVSNLCYKGETQLRDTMINLRLLQNNSNSRVASGRLVDSTDRSASGRWISTIHLATAGSLDHPWRLDGRHLVPLFFTINYMQLGVLMARQVLRHYRSFASRVNSKLKH